VSVCVFVSIVSKWLKLGSCKQLSLHMIDGVSSFLSPMIWRNLQEARLNWSLWTTNSLLCTQQVYLQMPMDRVTLVNAKSTMLHCQPSLITSQRASVNSKLLYRDREKSVITTYLNDNAQTPLGRFIVYTLHNELCNKYSDKSN